MYSITKDTYKGIKGKFLHLLYFISLADYSTSMNIEISFS